MAVKRRTVWMADERWAAIKRHAEKRGQSPSALIWDLFRGGPATVGTMMSGNPLGSQSSDGLGRSERAEERVPASSSFGSSKAAPKPSQVKR